MIEPWGSESIWLVDSIVYLLFNLIWKAGACEDLTVDHFVSSVIVGDEGGSVVLQSLKGCGESGQFGFGGVASFSRVGFGEGLEGLLGIVDLDVGGFYVLLC